MRRRPLPLVAASLVILGLFASAPPTTAECDGPYASFREAAPTAQRIVYGDVVAVRPVEWGVGDGLTSRFTVRGWSLLGGVRPDTVDVDDLPSTSCSGHLIARLGDRVAIAFAGRAFTTRVEVNAIAWLEGRLPDRIGLETITEPELLELVGVQLPVVGDPADPEGPPFGWFAIALLVGLAATSAVVFRLVLVDDR
jgi:hypothetical protein